MKVFKGPENRYLRIWVALVFLLLVVIAGLAYSNQRTNHALDRSRAATAQARAAAATANRAINCTNDVLAKRAQTTAADNKANVDFHNAFTADAKAFGVLLVDILTNAPSSKSTPDFLAYIKVHNKLIDVSASTARVLQADQDYRDAHPIGMC